ncbi:MULTISPECIES: hypothetical protein [unclassified Sphingomonas]|uniref:hypothetical protein n=1 Tax=unclassified Sphingomonas TaxID=196159 RepID=UPI000B1A0259|nr:MULTISPECIES: hypothetical protein [unclassified Sphingomonas]
MSDRQSLLRIGGWLSVVAALLHIGCIFGGPEWYRFFGAGEAMARMAERGHWYPPTITTGITIILAIWAAYAFSGAGMIARLPLLRTGLVVISAIYLLRGLLIIPILIHPPARTAFNIWSSVIVLGYGLVYALGTWRAWARLSGGAAGAGPARKPRIDQQRFENGRVRYFPILVGARADERSGGDKGLDP